MLLLLSTLLFGEEPKYTDIKKGDVAPFDGRLLNEPAIRILIEENATKQLECEALVQFKVNDALIKQTYKYDILKVQTDAEIKKLNELIKLQEEHIKQLKPQNGMWPFIGGVVIGTGLTIGVMYAVKPGVTQ